MVTRRVRRLVPLREAGRELDRQQVERVRERRAAGRAARPQADTTSSRAAGDRSSPSRRSKRCSRPSASRTTTADRARANRRPRPARPACRPRPEVRVEFHAARAVRISIAASRRSVRGSPGSRTGLDLGPAGDERCHQLAEGRARRSGRSFTTAGAADASSATRSARSADSRAESGAAAVDRQARGHARHRRRWARSSAQRGSAVRLVARLRTARQPRPGSVAWSRCEADQVQGIGDGENAERHGEHRAAAPLACSEAAAAPAGGPERRHEAPRRPVAPLDQAGPAAARSGAQRSRRPGARSRAWPRAAGRGPRRTLHRAGQGRAVAAQLPQPDPGDRQEGDVQAQPLADARGLAAGHLAMRPTRSRAGGAKRGQDQGGKAHRARPRPPTIGIERARRARSCSADVGERPGEVEQARARRRARNGATSAAGTVKKQPLDQRQADDPPGARRRATGASPCRSAGAR